MKARKLAAIAAVSAFAVAAAVPAIAGATPPVLAGKGTAICGPSNGSYNAKGGPGYAQYQEPPAAPQVFSILGCDD